MSGKQRYRQIATSQVERKEDRPLVFSGVLGVTMGGENQVDVPGRPGFVWVRLRNQLNELIQAFNETVSQVFDLPVLVEWDKASPTRYKVLGRDVGRYSSWGSTSSFLPRHGAQHSFNPAIGQTGGDIVWVYSQQFMPLLITPSGSAGSMSVSSQPAPYYYSDQFRWAGGTGISGFENMKPTTSGKARMILVYLDPDSGNILLATGSLTEFDDNITGTAQILPFMPSLIEPTDVPLAGVRLLTGSSALLWTNVYDLRDFMVHSSVSGSSGGGGAPTDAQYVTMALDGDLSAERVLTEGADIDIADGGANGNVTISVETGTFARVPHTHEASQVSDVFAHDVAIYEDGIFKVTGSIIDFGENVNVVVSGSVAFVSTVDTQGGGANLLIYDDNEFVATGSAISFDNNLNVSNTGSVVYVESPVTTYQRVGLATPLDGVSGATWRVPDMVFASGSLAVFVNGSLWTPGVTYEEMFWVSGTYRYLGSPSFPDGAKHMVIYGVPCIPQTQPPTGTALDFALQDSDSELLLDSDSEQLLDSDG